VKKAFYQVMFNVTESIMWLGPLDDRAHFARWWEVSEYYRRKRDMAG